MKNINPFQPFETNWNNSRSIKGTGLAKIPPPTGTLIAFSTSANYIAEDGHENNSIYCKSLSENLLKENTSIGQVFRNVRKEVLELTGQGTVNYDQLTGEPFYLVRPRFHEEFDLIDSLIDIGGEVHLSEAMGIVASILKMDSKNEQAQARTMDKVVVSVVESLDLKNMFWDVDVESVTDSALVFFEHFWSQPDQVKDVDSKPYRLSNYHFWRVSGIDLENVEMSGQFFYDGRIGGYLDVDLVSIQEDSLVLLYRTGASDDWTEYEFYSKNILGQSDNSWGLIELTKILPGEYSLANLDRTVLGLNNVDDESILEIFPNPARDEITVSLNNYTVLTDVLFEVFDLEGKLIQSESLTEQVSRLNVSRYAKGLYNYRLIEAGGVIDSGKFILN